MTSSTVTSPLAAHSYPPPPTALGSGSGLDASAATVTATAGTDASSSTGAAGSASGTLLHNQPASYRAAATPAHAEEGHRAQDARWAPKTDSPSSRSGEDATDLEDLEVYALDHVGRVRDSSGAGRPWDSRNGKTRRGRVSGNALRDEQEEDDYGEEEDGETRGIPPTNEQMRQRYWKRALVNTLLVASWYLWSTCISVYNKFLFSRDQYNFKYPLFVTSLHMFVQFALSSLALRLFPRWKPANNPSRRDWLFKVVPCAIATGLDIGLSNLSLKTITLSFYTMCKSSSLAFVLLFAFIFRLERPRLSLVAIIAVITIGVILMVSTETKFSLAGAIEVLSASAMGGLRWSLTQMFLHRESMGMNNPLATVFWLSPIMAVVLSSISLIFEGWGELFGSEHFSTLPQTLKTLGLVIFPGAMAFAMQLSEFGLISRTSVVTLSVFGIFKEVGTIVVASLVFGDELHVVNGIGLGITLLGIASYNYLKYRILTSADAAAAVQAKDAYVHHRLAMEEEEGEEEEANDGLGEGERRSSDKEREGFGDGQSEGSGIGLYNLAVESTPFLSLYAASPIPRHPDRPPLNPLNAAGRALSSPGVPRKSASLRRASSQQQGWRSSSGRDANADIAMGRMGGFENRAETSSAQGRERWAAMGRNEALFDLGEEEENQQQHNGGSSRAPVNSRSRTEEEANMDGWNHSGFESTGGGVVFEEDDENGGGEGESLVERR